MNSYHTPWDSTPPHPVSVLTGSGEESVRPRRGAVILILFVLLILISTVALAILQGRELLRSPAQRMADMFSFSWQVPGITSQFTVPGFNIPEFSYIPPVQQQSSTGTPATTIRRTPLAPEVSLILADKPAEDLTFQEIYDKVLPSIVSVEARRSTGVSLGTGIIMTESGYIITNHHIIEGASQADVILYDGSRLSAGLVGSDAETDLALLKVDAQGLTAAEFGDSTTLQVGDTALAIGNPLGRELFGTMTDGIISAINRDVQIESYTMTLVQTTAALNSGSSGGALVNTAGQVVGITNMKIMSSYRTIEGLGFAIPTASAKTVVDSLLDVGAATGRPSLGITCISLWMGAAEYYGRDSGVYIDTVFSSGPAANAGLQSGDIILSANGISTPGLDQLAPIRDEVGVGGELLLTVWRDGETFEVTVVLMDEYQINR